MKKGRFTFLIGAWTLLALSLLTSRAGAQSAVQFVRGDCNADGSNDISDPVFLLLFNFGSGITPSCLDACDANDDGKVTGEVTDAIFLLTYFFLSGPQPPSPGPSTCGEDPTADLITCGSYDRCLITPPEPPCVPFGVSSTGEQRNSDSAIAPSGNVIVVWEDDFDQDKSFNIRVGSFTPGEKDILDPFTVNSLSAGQQLNPAVAWSKDENFVVVWEDDSNSNGIFEVRARGFNADGTERFPQFTANTRSAGQQQRADVGMDDAGNFVVVWQDDGNGDGLYEINARGFTATGVERIPQFTVNTRSAGQQTNPVIAVDGRGNFVVAWENDGDGDGEFELKGRGFNADGTERIPQFDINDRSAGQQLNPAIAMDGSGRFVVAWEDDRDQNGSFQIHARGFNADGTERLPTFTANVFSAGQQINPAISMDGTGNFAIVWEDDRDLDGEFHIRMRAFNADGSERLAPVKVDCMEPAQHLDPTLVLDASGRVVVFWNEIDATEVVQVIGRTFSPAPPVVP